MKTCRISVCLFYWQIIFRESVSARERGRQRRKRQREKKCVCGLVCWRDGALKIILLIFRLTTVSPQNTVNIFID